MAYISKAKFPLPSEYPQGYHRS